MTIKDWLVFWFHLLSMWNILKSKKNPDSCECVCLMFSGWWEEGNCLTAWTLPVPHTRERAWPLQPGSGSGNTGWTRARIQRQRRHWEESTRPRAQAWLPSSLAWHKCGLSPAYLTVTDVTSINPLPGPAATTFNIQVHLPSNILYEQSSNIGVKIRGPNS